MGQKTTGEMVVHLIADHMGLADCAVQPETRIVADLDADSLDSIELLMAIEDEFALEISDDEAEKCVTVADCIALVERMLAKQTEARAAN